MNYTVTQLLKTRDPWSNDHGTFTPYAFKVEGQEKLILWNRKHQQGAAPAGPAVGDQLEGELEDKGNYLKYKKVQGGGGGGGGSKSYDRQPDHPVQMARVLHTSAMSLATTLIEQMVALDVIDKPKDKADYLALVTGVATWAQGTYPQPVIDQANKATA